MKIFIPVFIFLALNSQPEITVKRTIKIKSDKVVMDNLSYIYSIYKNRIIKLSEYGDTISSYYSPYGDIKNIDVTNPFKIFIEIDNNKNLIIVDNLLSQLALKINLEDVDIYSDFFFCGNAENGLWLFDKENSNIIKLDNNFNQVCIKELSPDKYKNIVSIYSLNNLLYLNLQNDKIVIFDRNIHFIKSIIVDIYSSFYISKNKINYYCNQNNTINCLNTSDFNETKYSIPNSIIFDDIFIKNHNLLFYNSNLIHIAKLK